MFILFSVIFVKSVLKKLFIIFLCLCLFLGLSYAYLYFNFNNDIKATDEKDNTVPYRNLPDNAGVAFLLPYDSAVLMYLDFEKEYINVINIEQYDEYNHLYYGYNVDFTVEIDYPLIGEIVDMVGGVEISLDNKIMRYTGIQIIDFISTNMQSNIKNDIINEIFSRISKNGFSKDDFIYIIENSNSDLSVVDCVYWFTYLDQMFCNINFVN